MREFYASVAVQGERRIPDTLRRGIRALLTMPEDLAVASDDPIEDLDVEAFARKLES